MQINAYRNRLAVDTSQQSGVSEVRNGSGPFIWNHSACRFEIAIFDRATLVEDVSNLDQIRVQIKPADIRTSLPVLSGSIDSGDIKQDLTQEDWDAGNPDDAHAVVEFNSDQVNIDLQGEDSVQYWLVISAQRADGAQIVLGCVQITIAEDGLTVDAPATVSAPIYLTLEQSDARYVHSLDLTTIENNITALQSDMSDAQADITAATATANGALQRSGGTMTGTLILAGAPASNLHAATKAYADLMLPLAGGTMTGVLVLSGAPTSNLHAATKLYVDTADALALPKAGGTMTGVLVLSGPPTSNLHAATKAYADLMLPLAGGTMTGTLILAGAPASGLHAATKAYADLMVPLAGGTMTGALILSGAPATGLQAATKAYADLMVPLAGGTMTGYLTLSAAPASNMHAATRLYVDTADALALLKAGGAMTGDLTFSGTGIAGLQLNNLTDAQKTALATTNAGMLIFNTTLGVPQVFTGSNWISLGAGGGGGGGSGSLWTLYTGSPKPPNSGYHTSTGAAFVLDADTGDIYAWDSGGGSYSVAIPPKLSLSGGTMTGAITFDGGIAGALSWPAEGYHIEGVPDGGVSYDLRISDSGFNPRFLFKSSNAFSIESGVLEIQGNQVVGPQLPGITVPSGGATVDSEARTAVTEVILRMRGHGLIA